MNKYFIPLLTFGMLFTTACGGDNPDTPPQPDPEGPTTPTEPEKPSTPVGYEVGKTLPLWSDGYLDVHYINTGRGECQFMIMPDGTTLIIDAGEMKEDETSVPQKPDASTRPYVTYAKYIKHFLPQGHTAIDWCAPSHFHIDHIGDTQVSTSTAPGGYALSGLTALFDEVPYNNVVDRGYPTYSDDPSIPPIDGRLAKDWQKFVKWGVSAGKFKAARFAVGEEQITMLSDRTKYPSFRIFNIVGNGRAVIKDASGKMTVTNTNMTEPGNPNSCGIHLTYGNFDYITCGDLANAPQNRVASYYEAYIGKGKLDLFKAHHHMNSNGWGTQMRRSEFSPRVVVVHSFKTGAPNPGMLSNVVLGNFDTHSYTWTKDIFCTNIADNIVNGNPSLYSNVAGRNGHIVVRVNPGGDEYYVYMLDDTDSEYKIKSIHGPYKSN